MKLALQIISLITVLAIGLFYLTSGRNPNEPTAMPWHVNVIDSNHSEIFGIELNTTTLEQARQQFGQLDGIGLFRNEQGWYSLEAYFGKVTIGPFSARIIANLEGTQDELENLSGHTIKRIVTENGSQRWTLEADKQVEQGQRIIRSLTYIPVYTGMDEKFIRERFGEPDSQKRVDDTTRLWLYPRMGVRIMVDNEGKEMFEYMTVDAFRSIGTTL